MGKAPADSRATGIEWFCAFQFLRERSFSAEWHPREYCYQRLGCEVNFRFPCCKLLDILPRVQNDESLPALAARAQIAALQTSRHPDKRLAARWQLVRSLYQQGFGKEEIREAFRLIAWMMRLPK